MFFLGVDGGGTKTVGLLADERGETRARVEAGSGNYHAVGLEAFEATLRALIGELCASVGGIGRVESAALGLAGVARPEDHAVIRPILQRLGFPVRTLLTHDARIALVAGAEKDEGVILIAGTGSIAYGRSASGEEARSGGWGHLLGDEGSGYGLGLDALRAVVRAEDGRDAPTLLTGRVLAALGLERPAALVRWVGDASKSAIAALAPLVFEAADQDDPTARTILSRGSAGLAELAGSVLRRLKWTEPPTLVLGGGLFSREAAYRERTVERIAAECGPVRVSIPAQEPAHGAIQLARQNAATTSLASSAP